VIGASETTRVSYNKNKPQVESERRKAPRQPQKVSSTRAGVQGPKPTGAGRRVANEKRDERDRRRASIARRRVALLFVLAILVGAAVWGIVQLWQAPLFPVKTVTVSGNSRLTSEAVLASAAIPGDATVVRLPEAQIEQRLLANPWIAEARVERRFPDGVSVSIVERTPAALVDAGGTELWLISSDGHWLGKRSADDTVSVVTIRDIESLTPTAGVAAKVPELTNALAVLGGLSPELKSLVRAVSAPTVDKTALVLKGDVQVFVGSADEIQKKDQLARKILADEKNVVYVNVRVTSRPTWRGLGQAN
jgi:cell division protein FtsQ